MLKKRGKVVTQAMKVVLRRTTKLTLKPESEQLDGEVYLFRVGDIMNDVVTSIYIGERMFHPWDLNYPTDAPAWIASGDLEEFK